VPALRTDADLANAAQQAAERFFRPPWPSQDDVVAGAGQALGTLAPRLQGLGGMMIVVGSLDEATGLEPLEDAAVRRIGIGVAQGDREDTGPRSIAVIYLFAKDGGGL
jgi:hypothetical protein